MGGPDRRLLFVISLAFLVRLIFLLESASNPTFASPLVDSESYDALARDLAGGGRLTRELFWQPLFYPVFLATVYAATGGSILAAKLVQIALGAVTCGLTYRLGRAVDGERTGLVAGMIAALYGPLVLFDAELLATGWAAFWSAALLLLVLRAAQAPRRSVCLALGICLALATITRPTFLPFAFAAPAWLAFQWPGRGARRGEVAVALATCVAGFLLVGLPIMTLTAEIAGRFSLLPASGGINLFLGNNPQRTETLNTRPGWKWQQLTHSPRLHGVNEQKDTPRYFKDRFVDYVRSEPLDFAAGIGTKSAEMVSSREMPRNIDPYLFRRWSTVLSSLLWKIGSFGFPFGLLLPLAGVGLIRGRASLPAPLSLFLLLYSASVVLVFVSARYRTPIVIPLCVPAAIGVVALFDAARNGRWRRLAVDATVAGSILLLATLPGPFPREDGPYEAELYYLLGRRAAERGEREPALLYTSKSLELEPHHADAHTVRGNLMDENGQHDEAVRHYLDALSTDPGHAIARANLARVLARKRDYRAAERHLGLALEAAPYDTELFEDYATILAWQGRQAEALEVLGRAIEIRPDDADLHDRTGRVLLGMGRFEDASTAFERSLALEPFNLEVLEALTLILTRQGRVEMAQARVRATLAQAEAAGRPELVRAIRERLLPSD